MDELSPDIIESLEMNAAMRVAHNLARALDRCDAEAIQNCFHPDGTDDHGIFKGTSSEFVTWVVPELEKYKKTQHMIGTQTAKISGKKVACESYFQAHHVIEVPDGTLQILVSGRYLDNLEKRDNHWKIMHRLCVVDWTDMGPISKISGPENVEMAEAKRDKTDPSYEMFSKI